MQVQLQLVVIFCIGFCLIGLCLKEGCPACRQAPLQLQQLAQAKAALERAAQNRPPAAQGAPEGEAIARNGPQSHVAWEDNVPAGLAGCGAAKAGMYGWGLDTLDFSGGGGGGGGGDRENVAESRGRVNVNIVDWVRPQAAAAGQAWDEPGLGSEAEPAPGSGPWTPPAAGPMVELAWPGGLPEAPALGRAGERPSSAWSDEGPGAAHGSADKGLGGSHDASCSSGIPPGQSPVSPPLGIARAAVASGHWPAVPSAQVLQANPTAGTDPAKPSGGPVRTPSASTPINPRLGASYAAAAAAGPSEVAREDAGGGAKTLIGYERAKSAARGGGGGRGGGRAADDPFASLLAGDLRVQSPR